MGGHKTISCSLYPTLTSLAANYHVVDYPGTVMIPDAKGDYFVQGNYDGEPYYKHVNKTFFLWYDMFQDHYYLSDEVGNFHGGFWAKTTGGVIGSYYPYLSYFGTALTVLGPV